MGVVSSGYTGFSDTSDCFGHGTSVASIAAGGTLGVAPAANIVGLRVCDCAGTCPYSMVISGLNWIVTTVSALRRLTDSGTLASTRVSKTSSIAEDALSCLDVRLIVWYFNLKGTCACTRTRTLTHTCTGTHAHAHSLL